MQKLSWILEISRPRFWFYLLGPLLLGMASYPFIQFSISDGNVQAALVAAFLFFGIPANLLIYGVNDLYDYDTDVHNPKKKSYETLLQPSERKKLLIWSSLFILPSLFVLLFALVFNISVESALTLQLEPNEVALWSLAAFLFFGIGYSAPPIRAKTKPFFDAFFNILYIFPGLIAYGILAEQFPPLAVIIAATLWCMAMHAFSAVPDIQADTKASLRTTATTLGSTGTILFCTVCYFASALLVYPYLGLWSLVGLLIYGAMMFFAYGAKNGEELFNVYKAFPYVNIVFGFVLFWVIILINRNIL